jgi:hypothetical protein
MYTFSDFELFKVVIKMCKTAGPAHLNPLEKLIFSCPEQL